MMYRLAEEDQKVSLAWYLIVAALFHAVVWKTAKFPVAPLNPFAARPADPIEVEGFEKALQRPVVKTDTVPFDKALLKKKARFAGEVDNRVEEETQSPRSGQFMPGGMALQRERALARQNPAEKKPIDGTADGDVPQEDLKNWRRPGEIGMSDLMAYGASPTRFPNDVKVGTNTVLNTDQVSYASYFNRMAEELYDRWNGRIDEAFQEAKMLGKKIDQEEYLTVLRIVLDDKGSVLSITTLKSSGLHSLDEACKRAFWDSEPFPNPPTQLLNADRQIVIPSYGFSVYLNNSLFQLRPRRL